MKRFRFGSLFLSALCAVLFSFNAVPAYTQTTSMGTIVGVVTDVSNAVVSGATVTLTDAATAQTRTVTTNDAGRYTFVDLPSGKYDIAVTKTGFVKVSIPAQVVQVGVITTDNVTLKVGAATQTIEVQATGVELQTQGMSIGSTMSSLALDNLPSLGRDISTFLTLQPGISPDGSVAGTVVDQSSFQLDGGNNTNDMDGSMSVYTPSFAGDPTGGMANQSAGLAAGATGVMPTPADSVEEFKVDYGQPDRRLQQLGRRAGASGDQARHEAWHGTVYEYYLDNNFSANTWENNNSTEFRSPASTTAALAARSAVRSFPRCWVGRPTSLPTTRASAGPIPPPSKGLFPRQPCGSGCCTFDGADLQPEPTPVTFNGVTYAPTQCPAGPGGARFHAILEALESILLCSRSGTSTMPRRMIRVRPQPVATDQRSGIHSQPRHPAERQLWSRPLGSRFRRQVALHDQLSLLQVDSRHHRPGRYWRLLPRRYAGVRFP